jgi:hypothetical protein
MNQYVPCVSVTPAVEEIINLKVYNNYCSKKLKIWPTCIWYIDVLVHRNQYSTNWEKTNKITYLGCIPLAKYVLLKMHKFFEIAELFHKIFIYYTQIGQIFHLFIIFDFQQLLLLAKIDRTSGYGDRKCQKSW